jgi:hypothetical protein
LLFAYYFIRFPKASLVQEFFLSSFNKLEESTLQEFVTQVAVVALEGVQADVVCLSSTDSLNIIEPHFNSAKDNSLLYSISLLIVSGLKEIILNFASSETLVSFLILSKGISLTTQLISIFKTD